MEKVFRFESGCPDGTVVVTHVVASSELNARVAPNLAEMPTVYPADLFSFVQESDCV